jgi:DNA-binding SARP family transcriptional activator
MLCRLLGPLEVRAGESWTAVSAPKWRALLAALLLRPGQVVSVGQLADELWGSSPPAHARKLVSGYVARLRQLIGDADGQLLVTTPPGYRLLVGPADLDVSQFERLVAAARAALDQTRTDRASTEQPRAELAAELLGEALALWRGPALADVPPGPVVAAEVARLEELRLDALELRVEAGIGSGRAAELVADLRQLVIGYPLRERFWHQLMRSLEQAGRTAEALEAYVQAQKILAEELGADPGPDLQQLHRRLLAGPQASAASAAPLLATASPAPSATPSDVTVAAPAVLRQLPASGPHFTGRADELAALTRLLDQVGAGQPGTVVISAIDGMPGVGKTALVVRAGHLLAHRFGDRQLFVDLHGHTPGRDPADPAEVLAALLAADGVDHRYLPASLDGRAAMWRDRVAGQRVLLILDNAAGSAQVAPLLPGSAGSLVLVTSRRYLGDLAAAHRVMLDVLPPRDALVMFADLAPGAAGELEQVAELVELCGRLPLAVSLVARLFTRHRSWTMADLIGQTRARLLTVTAENRTVAAAFEASYQDLDPERQRFFRYLGLHPGPEIDAFAAAALTNLPSAEAAAQLEALYGDRLLEEPVPHRFQFHDLIRQYALSLVAGDSGAERERAIGRLLDYYQHTALAADAHLARHTRPAAAAVARPAMAVGFPDRIGAQAWMAAERANLAACIDFAVARGDQARAVGLTAAIAAPLRSEGPWTLAIARHSGAVQAAEHLGDQRGLARALLDLADVQYLTSDNHSAAAALARARDLYRDLGDRSGEANALYSLGVAQQQLADGFPLALELTGQALGLYRGLGDRLGEANALSSIGIVRRQAGDYAEASAPLEQALDIFRAIGNPAGEANALRGLAAVRQLTGDYPDAARLLEQALEICRGVGDRNGEAYALFGLGSVWQLTGDYPGAIGALEQALRIHRQIGSLRGEAYDCQQLGDTLRAAGDLPAATRLLELSLTMCRQVSDRIGEAYSLLSLGQVRRAARDLPAAMRLLARALDLFSQLGDQGGESEALNETGTVRLAQADPLHARVCFQRALELARATGARLHEARALEGLGRCAAHPCEASAAGSALRAQAPAVRSADVNPQTVLRQALEIYQRLGAADAARLGAELDAASARLALVRHSADAMRYS